MRVALFFTAGLFIIAGVVCFGFFYHNGSIEALGGAMMFMCFGFAGFVVGNYTKQLSTPVSTNDNPESSY